MKQQVQYDALRKHQKRPGSRFFKELGIDENVSCGQLAASLQRRQAFREFLVSPAHISNLNVHKAQCIGILNAKYLVFVTSFICSLLLFSGSISREI